jgi:hypothetical protein
MANSKKKSYLRTAKAKVQIHLPKKKGKMTLTVILPANIEKQLAGRLSKRFR